MADELRTTVGGDVIGYSEAGYSMMTEGPCTGLGGGV